MRLRRRRDHRTFDDHYFDTLAEQVQRLVEHGTDINEALEAAGKAVGSTPDISAPRLAAALVRRAPRMLRERRRLHRGFNRRLRKHWGRGLDLLYVITVCCEEAGADFYTERVAKRGHYSRRALHEALTGLHARASRTALEVQHLLSGGFPMGALARCRTLHELAVTSMILAKYGVRDEHADLAERFLLHADVQSWSEAQTHQQNWVALGSEPFSEEDMAALKARRETLIGQYGPDYKGTYGWAAGIEGMTKPQFSDLERVAEVRHLRGYYRWASHEVHSDSKGSALNVRERGGQPFKQSGYTNVGLADPGQLAAISLHQVTVSVLLSEDPISPRDLLTLMAMQHLLDDVCEAMVEGERSVESAEERHQARKAGRRGRRWPFWLLRS